TFIAACYLKADEIDSEWDFGRFIGELACAWIQARQTAAVDPEETARTLLLWIDRDNYGFMNDLGTDAVKVLNETGLTAFEKEIQARFEAACENSQEQSGNYRCNHWGTVLRSIYMQQRSVEKYLNLTARTGLTPADCANIASMLQGKRKFKDALEWVERGLKLEDVPSLHVGLGCNLATMRRALMEKLGRGGESLDSAWEEFQARPGMLTWEELHRYVPKSERGSWHEKAMAAAEQGNLAPFIELCLETKETGRLANRLSCCADRELEALSHYVMEPAAKALAKAQPAIAARLFRAMCVRILNAGKSKYYDASLANIGEARRYYLAAGLSDQWELLVTEIRRNHYRKSAFMPGFEAIAAGKRAREKQTYLDKAYSQWMRRT
ncbi:MAG: DUF6880 family protein, partial [Terriglobia bacterium]